MASYIPQHRRVFCMYPHAQRKEVVEAMMGYTGSSSYTANQHYSKFMKEVPPSDLMFPSLDIIIDAQNSLRTMADVQNGTPELERPTTIAECDALIKAAQEIADVADQGGEPTDAHMLVRYAHDAVRDLKLTKSRLEV